MNRKCAILVLGTLLVPFAVGAVMTWHVDDSVSSSGDGKTWATAFKIIREGVDASSDGDTVIVAEGTYYENIHFNGKNIVLTGTDPLDPETVANTVIDGNHAGSVVTFAGTETDACVLSGFTIRNGSAGEGGGIFGGEYPAYTHVAIQNNTIIGNEARQAAVGWLAATG